MTRSEFIQRATLEIALHDPSFSRAAITNAINKAVSLADALQVSQAAPWSLEISDAINGIGQAIDEIGPIQIESGS